MKVVFRVDASVSIGTGHVMRCLTLANALKNAGAVVAFVCRLHEGHLVQTIQQQGFKVYPLESCEYLSEVDDVTTPLFHAEWLGTTQAKDAKECRPILQAIQADWLIVDHYAIDRVWQGALTGCYRNLMVIDDLTDRVHVADLLLNQNYGAIPEDYHALVSQKCRLLMGCHYALLREEFVQWRPLSLARRHKPEFKKILITLGGVDSDNLTGAVLDQVARLEWISALSIIVVMGENSLHKNRVKEQVALLPCSSEFLVNVTNMAELMTQADLAIGAAGATTWERCCLGLPTIQLVIALNQEQVAARLEQDGIVKTINHPQDLEQVLSTAVDWMPKLSHLSASICDGRGCERVIQAMYSFNL